MKWEINFSKESIKFLNKNSIDDSYIIDSINKGINKLSGKPSENINLKKLKGNWSGFYRIRHGNIRIIFDISFNNRNIWIEKIDFRGNIY